MPDPPPSPLSMDDIDWDAQEHLHIDHRDGLWESFYDNHISPAPSEAPEPAAAEPTRPPELVASTTELATWLDDPSREDGPPGTFADNVLGIKWYKDEGRWKIVCACGKTPLVEISHSLDNYRYRHLLTPSHVAGCENRRALAREAASSVAVDVQVAIAATDAACLALTSPGVPAPSARGSQLQVVSPHPEPVSKLQEFIASSAGIFEVRAGECRDQAYCTWCFKFFSWPLEDGRLLPALQTHELTKEHKAGRVSIARFYPPAAVEVPIASETSTPPALSLNDLCWAFRGPFVTAGCSLPIGPLVEERAYGPTWFTEPTSWNIAGVAGHGMLRSTACLRLCTSGSTGVRRPHLRCIECDKLSRDDGIRCRLVRRQSTEDCDESRINLRHLPHPVAG